ncbi:hypothetical protein NPIL_225921 [Nephila pilipes]|uniref:Uncharacterized protein n=1 Tax=Nephila pilipes TaxID=299642 RepID=A0A8X6QMU2_NEPPI|nr:hypothetical protein NPIL_225921 [Nephila pilipes]
MRRRFSFPPTAQATILNSLITLWGWRHRLKRPYLESATAHPGRKTKERENPQLLEETNRTSQAPDDPCPRMGSPTPRPPESEPPRGSNNNSNNFRLSKRQTRTRSIEIGRRSLLYERLLRSPSPKGATPSRVSFYCITIRSSLRLGRSCQHLRLRSKLRSTWAFRTHPRLGPFDRALQIKYLQRTENLACEKLDGADPKPRYVTSILFKQ